MRLTERWAALDEDGRRLAVAAVGREQAVAAVGRERAVAAVGHEQAVAAVGRERAVRAARGRVGVPDLTRREVWDHRDPAAVDAILAEAAADRGRPWPRTVLSDYARFWRDGVRTAYEGPAGEVRRRTSTAVLAAALTADQAYVDEAADGLMLLCEQTTWCWVAHESFATARGEVAGDPDKPYLDLGAAETAEILAWADLVLAPALDERVPGLRRRMRREVRQRIIQPFLTDRSWHWLGGRLHNWNPWIHGHVLAVALFLEDDPQVQLEVTDLVVDGLSRYLDAMPADGGCDEGYAYWWNGPARLAVALDVLDRVTDGAFDPWSCTPLAELARYPQRVALADGWYVNVADGSARPDPNQPWHVLHRWGRSHQDPEVMAQAAAHRDMPIAPAAGLGRAVLGLTDDAWWDAEKADLPLPTSTWLPDVQLFVARSQQLTLAIKGGHNDENHNHNDVGSFIAAIDSTPVLIDLGQPTYTALSFSDRRYEQWVVQSGWHNVPLINGHEQQHGPQYKASDLVVEENSLALELSRAYPNASRYRRVATLEDDAITIADEWEGSVVQHFVIAGTPISQGPHEVVVETLSGGRAHLSWDAGTGRLEQRSVDDALLEGVWGPTVHRLIIDCTGTTFRLTVARETVSA